MSLNEDDAQRLAKAIEDERELRQGKSMLVGCGGIIGVALLFGVIVGICSAVAPPSSDDLVAQQACDAWVQTYGDGRDGLLTRDELRNRISSIYGDAQFANDAEIRSSGRALLAAATSGSDDELVAAMEDFTRACGITD